MTDTELLDRSTQYVDVRIVCDSNGYWAVSPKGVVIGHSGWSRTLREALQLAYDRYAIPAIEDEPLLPIPLDEGV